MPPPHAAEHASRPAPEAMSVLASRIVAPNPGPMTLEGTNTFLLRAPDADDLVVVDPGPKVGQHLERVAASGRIALILLTHHHYDHAQLAGPLAQLSGAPVRAWDPSLCIDGTQLRAGEQFEAAGVRIEVLHTPGHTADSVSFRLVDDRPLAERPAPSNGSVLTGDTILGRGTTTIAGPDGSLRDYLSSLDVLREIGEGMQVLPAHGPSLPDLSRIARLYSGHRRQRTTEAVAALQDLGLEASVDDATVAAVTDRVYKDLAPVLRGAAESITRAHLEYLAESD